MVALAGLSAFQGRTHLRLAWAAFALPAVGTIAFTIGLVGMNLLGEPYWAVWFFGTMTALMGSALFGIATYRMAALSRRAAMLPVVGPALALVSLLVTQLSWDLGIVVVGAALICFMLGWFALGVQAIRLDGPATEPRPA